VMGEVSEKYGFIPMAGESSNGVQFDGTPAVDDAGEAVTLADASTLKQA